MSSTINCKYLRCAQEYISRTKLSDDDNCCVRVQHCEPIDNNNLYNTTTTPKYNNDDIQHLDKVQRRKEKKRRKKELRNKMKDELSMQIQSIRVTTTSFPPLTTCKLEQSVVHIKPLIVLDLNGILCHRIREKNTVNTKSSMYRPSLGSVSKTEVIPRSDLHEFLSLLHDNFSLAVWTSATRKTARMLVQLLFPEEMRDRLVFVWHRNFCSLLEKSESTSSSTEEMQPSKEEECNTPPSRKRRRRGNQSRIDKLMCSPVNDDDDNTDEFDKSSSAIATKCVKRKASANKAICHNDVTAIKSLSKVWSAYPLWDETNTILLDDSKEKCPTQHSANALHPLSIRGTITACNNEDSAKEEDVKSKDSYSIIDDDETNQKSQFAFFELLAKYWLNSTSPPADILMCFLKEHANKHNMGWEMGSANAKV